MSHEIEAAVFSQSEGAGWTGLGLAIPADAAKDPRRIAELLGATWTVLSRPVFYQSESGEYLPASDAAAQVRSDTGRILSLTSESRYHVTNRQPIDVLEAFRDDLARESLTISHAAVLRGGGVIAVSALMNGDHDIGVSVPGASQPDVMRSYITLSTGYDKKHGTKASKGTVRVVCANTLAASIADATRKQTLRTISAASPIEFGTLHALISQVRELEATERVLFDSFANRRMSEADVARYFADVLEINIENLNQRDRNGREMVSTKARNMLAAIVTAYRQAPGAASATGTAWGALNAVTYYGTHVKTVRDTCDDGAAVARVSSNMTGDAAKLKARALAILADRVAVAA